MKNPKLLLLLALVCWHAKSIVAQNVFNGYLDAEVSLGENGESKISVQLNIPKGTASLQPFLSLNYNSQAGNNIAGIGWTLDGVVQAITRTGKTLAQDNQSAQPSFGTDCRYSLNGQRLIATFAYSNWTGLCEGYLEEAKYGGYLRTEEESFSKVVPHVSYHAGSCNEPDSFTVFTKSGLILSFGAGINSKIELNGQPNRVYSWLLDKVSDRNGNYYTISYVKNVLTNEAYPAEIKYTGNTKAGVLPYNKISFNYEARPDSTSRNAIGYIFKSTKRLSSIIATDNDTLFRKYQLTYLASGSSRLSKITEFGTDGVTSSLPLQFNYTAQPATPGFTKTGSGTWQGNTGGIADNIFADMNGDGRTDMVKYLNAGIWTVSISTGKGFITSNWPGGHTGGINNTITTDVNGDGKADLVYYSGNGSWVVSISTGSGFISSTWPTSPTSVNYTYKYAFDYNGDGRSDLIARSSTGMWDIYQSTGTGFVRITKDGGYTGGTNPNLVGNFNSDNRSDIATYKSGSVWSIATPADNGFLIQDQTVNAGDISNTIAIDANGDGLTDFLRNETGNTWKISWSKGDGSFLNSTITIGTGPASSYISGDFNNDGYADVAKYAASNTWTVYLSNGNGFTNAGNWIGHPGGVANNAVVDLDGNGGADLISFNSGTSWTVALSNCEKDFVQSVSKGNGTTTTFIYSPISDTSIFTKGSGAVYPAMDFLGAYYVVKSITSDNGLGGNHEIKYRYTGAKLDLQGRGFAGFEKIIASDSLENSVLTTRYNTDFQYRGARILSAEIRTMDGILLQNITNVPGRRLIHFAEDTSWFCYYSKIKVSTYDLGTLISVKSTAITIDDFGNNTDKTIEDSIPSYTLGGSYSKYTVSTKNSFDYSFTNSSNWIIDQLKSTSTTKDLIQPNLLPGAITKSINYFYNSNGELIKQIMYPGHYSLELTTSYTLDAYSNRTLITISGPAITARSDSYAFDKQGRFIVSVKNAIGQVIKSSFKNGYPATQTNANNLTTTFKNDVFGRPVAVIFPGNISEQTSYFSCSGSACPVTALYYVKKQTAGKGYKILYYDKYDREVRQDGEGFSNRVLIDRTYNPIGLISKMSNLYTSGSSNIVYTSYEYDKVGRMIRETLPTNQYRQYYYSMNTKSTTNFEGQQTGIEFLYDQSPFKITDANGNSLKYLYNSDFTINSVCMLNGRNETCMTNYYYDLNGNKTYMYDFDKGKFYYTYNCLGLLIQMQNAAGEVTTFSYDLLNRMISRTEKEGVTTWEYDPVNGAGELYRVRVNGKDVETFEYNSLGQVFRHNYFRNGSVKTEESVYNPAGFIDTYTFPNSVRLKYAYTSNGYLATVTGYNIKSTPVILWTALDYDKSGKPAKFSMGNSMITNHQYDSITGYLKNIKVGTAKVPDSIQNQSFSFSILGNLTSRIDYKINKSESFEYTVLNQLAKTQVTGLDPKFITYDYLGNIAFKTGIGEYKYNENGAGPYHLTSITNSSKANCDYLFNETISYSSYGNVIRIADDNVEAGFEYAPSREKSKMTITAKGRVLSAINYFGQFYNEFTDSTGKINEQCFVKIGSQVLAVISGLKPASGATTYQVTYQHYDHIGSLYAQTSETGKVLNKFSYDAFGKQRNPLTWADIDMMANIPPFEKGFTGQQMLAIDFLVFMNSRVLNTITGRFLSPDPFVQDPYDMQSFNGYAYVFNNPLSNTDPSGYFSLSHAFRSIIHGVTDFVKDNKGLIISVAVMALTYGAGGTLSFGILNGAMSGYTTAVWTSLLSGQGLGSSIKNGLHAAVWGGLTAGLTQGIDQYIPGRGFWQSELNAVAHGVAQGTVREWQGGSFSTGFKRGFLQENARIIMDGFTKWQLEEDKKHGCSMNEDQISRSGATFKTAASGATDKQLANGYVCSFTDPDATMVGLDIPYGANTATFFQKYLGEDSRLMSWVARNIPGMNGMAHLHDAWANFSQTGFVPLDYIISVSTIPPAIFAEYNALHLSYYSNGIIKQ